MTSSTTGNPALDIFSLAIDTGGRIISWSPKAAEVLGHSSEATVGRDFGEYIRDASFYPGCEAEGTAGIWAAAVIGAEVMLWLLAEEGYTVCARFAPKHTGKNQFVHLFSIGHTPPTEELLPWPVDVQPVEGCGLAGFAVRDLAAYTTVFEEEPFFTRLQPVAMKGRKEWDDAWAEAFGRIRATLRFPTESISSPGVPLLASSALVRDALGFAACTEGVKSALLGLSHPPGDFDHALVQVARQVAELCKANLKECKRLDTDHLTAGILATEMNVFPGGRLFWTTSRMNHSCAPNCIFNSVPGKWGLKTIRNISAGEEITLSYLGEELLWPTEHRQRALWRSKCFVCQCVRCRAATDPMRDRPCIICMSRSFKSWRVIHRPGVWCRTEATTQSRALGLIKTGETVATTGEMRTNEDGEWVEVDPEQRKRGGWMLVNGAALGLGQLLIPSSEHKADWHSGQGAAEPGSLGARFWALTGKGLEEKAQGRWYSRRDLVDLELPRHCLEASPLASETGAQGTAYAHFQDGCWRCPRCGCEERRPELHAAETALGDTARKVFSLDLSEHQHMSVSGQGRGLPLPDDQFVLHALRLADDAGSILGRRHWIWQLGLLYVVDLDLSLPKWTNVRMSVAHHLGTAQALLEVWDWLGSLGLSSEPGLWLYKRAVAVVKVLDCCLHPALDAVTKELHRRIDLCTPFVDLLGPREFIPQSMFIAN